MHVTRHKNLNGQAETPRVRRSTEESTSTIPFRVLIGRGQMPLHNRSLTTGQASTRKPQQPAPTMKHDHTHTPDCLSISKRAYLQTPSRKYKRTSSLPNKLPAYENAKSAKGVKCQMKIPSHKADPPKAHHHQAGSWERSISTTEKTHEACSFSLKGFGLTMPVHKSCHDCWGRLQG